MTTNGDADPAAEFLAREQETLAGLVEDNLNLSTTSTIRTSDGEDGYGSSDSSKPEPEKIRIWRETHEKMLKAKDEEEAVKKEELRHTAKKELEEWYTRYAEQLEKSKKANRNAEKEWIAERDQKEEPGQEWEKIAKMCDFNPKSAKNSKDTTRLRSILLQLKQSPPSVDGTNWGKDVLEDILISVISLYSYYGNTFQ